MNLSKLSICSLLFASASLLPAASLFRVLGVRGTPRVAQHGKSERLHAGRELGAGDVVTLSANDYAGLVHKNGRGIELKSAGTYAVSDLASKVPTGSSSIASRVAKYMIDQMEQSNAPVEISDRHRADMGTSGSVERLAGDSSASAATSVGAMATTAGSGDRAQAEKIAHGADQVSAFLSKSQPTGSPDALFTVMPRSTSIVDPVIHFRWRAGKPGPFKFVITDSRGRPVYEKETGGDTLSVAVSQVPMREESNYYWRVFYAKDPDRGTTEQMLYVLSPATAGPILDTLAQLKTELGNEASSVAQLVIAAYCEDHTLLTRAADAYERAIALSPGARDYEDAYHNYLRRIGAGQ
jgi:hypothetical protein